MSGGKQFICICVFHIENLLTVNAKENNSWQYFEFKNLPTFQNLSINQSEHC
jgi:hypothetical protein